MNRLISIAIIAGLCACASVSQSKPRWNLPEVPVIEVNSISYSHGGVGEVYVVVNNKTDKAYCITNQIYSGKVSHLLASDLIDNHGKYVSFEDRGVLTDEDEGLQKLDAKTKTQLTLNYGGQYSQTAPKGKKVKFRVVLPAKNCTNSMPEIFSPDVILVSGFQEIFLPQ